MTTKAEYLKRYLESTSDKKRKKRLKKRSNLAVHDDDVDWRSLAPANKDDNHSGKEDNDPDEAPLIAEFKDDSVKKWQPLLSTRATAFENKSEDSNGSWKEIDVKRDRMDSLDLSPPRMTRLSDEDLSPPRQKRSSSSDLSPPRRTRLSDENLSPPHQKRSSSSDLSPPRRGSVKRRKMGETTVSSEKTKLKDKRRRPLSPDVISSLGSNRSRRLDSDTDNDHSPPRRKKVKQDLSKDGGVGTTTVSQAEGITARMVSNKKASIKISEEIQRENILVKNQQKEYCEGLDLTISSKHAETVYRDKEGRRIDPKLEMLKKEQEERLMQKENEKFALWGRGIAQTKSTKEKIEDDLYEMSKPLARYADDEDLERMLKEREREGDPMLAFIKKKTEKVKISQGKKPKKEKPLFQGSAPPNRFGIRPGYRWDGVDRSNGFEKAWFSRESNKKAFDEEAYKWSVEDM